MIEFQYTSNRLYTSLLPYDIIHLTEKYGLPEQLFDVLHVDQKLTSKSLRIISEANLKMSSLNQGMSDFYKRCIKKNVSQTFVFWKMIDFLHRTAKSLDCDISMPTNLSIENCMQWEVEHCYELFESTRKKGEEIQKSEFNKFVFKVYERITNRKLDIRDRAAASEAWKAMINPSDEKSKSSLKRFPHLDLEEASLFFLPKEIRALTHLTQLDLNRNKFQFIPNEILSEKGLGNNLLHLDLSSNNLFILPADISHCVNLLTLKCWGNQLYFLPKSLTKLTKLEELCLSKNQFSCVPIQILSLTNLKNLNLTMNFLHVVPDRFFDLKLTCLYLSYNLLQQLPISLGNQTSLTALNLDGNQLKILPDSFENLTNLVKLFFAENCVENFPSNIGKMTSLQSIFCRDNNIKSVPASIGLLTNLVHLDLIKNKLSSIPSEIGNLTNLESLYLDGNPIESLPLSIENLDIKIRNSFKDIS